MASPAIRWPAEAIGVDRAEPLFEEGRASRWCALAFDRSGVVHGRQAYPTGQTVRLRYRPGRPGAWAASQENTLASYWGNSGQEYRPSDRRRQLEPKAYPAMRGSVQVALHSVRNRPDQRSI